MITNKDINITSDGLIILNGNKYQLASQAEIDAITDTIGDITQSGVTGADVAAQLGALDTTIGDITQTGITGASVAAQLSNIGVKATWTPKIYDNQIYKRDVAGNQYYFKIGNLYTMFIEGTLDYSEITTVVVIGNLPCTTCIGGTVYLGGLVQGSIGVVGNTIQGVENRAVLRPNVVSTDFATPTAAPNNRFVLFGID